MSNGKVYLVGAGPGDPDLITVKGLDCIKSADVIIYDRLVDKRLLCHADANSELIYVGKFPGGPERSQDEINKLLVNKATLGKRIVRLKGGDPFIFGRGGEEAEILYDEGISFEIVPGITSAIAAPSYAGIPLTHRDISSSFTVITGNESYNKKNSPIDLNTLPLNDTLVILMGWSQLKNIIENLLLHGRNPKTPVAIIQWGTQPYQKTIVGTLSNIIEKSSKLKLSPPVVIVIGKTINLRKKLRWFDTRPLFGKKILVTKPYGQKEHLTDLLLKQGAETIELPTIKIVPNEDYTQLDHAICNMQAYKWIIFTSVNVVDVIFGRLATLGLDARAFGVTKVSAIGSSTANKLKSHGIFPDFVPNDFVSTAIPKGISNLGFKKGNILLPQAKMAPNTLKRELTNIGATVERITTYDTIASEDASTIFNEVKSKEIDVATFTSSSAAQNLSKILNGNLDFIGNATIACIGPKTADAAREIGLEVDIVSETHTNVGLVKSLESYFAN